jgi:hypothetical protein
MERKAKMLLDFDDLYKHKVGISARWASPENPRGNKGSGGMVKGGRKGRPSVSLSAGEECVLAEEAGVSGTIRRIWCTVSDRSPRMLRSLRMDFYWDEARKPSFSVPLSDFFGIGLGRITRFDSMLFSSPEGRSLNCFVPMPFRTGMKIIITNESDTDLSALYYDIDYTLGDSHGDDVLYFHAHYRRENPTVMRKDYEIVPPLRGRGRFLGTTIGVIVNRRVYHRTWWGEGEIKVFIDDDDIHPTLCGTGTEDYIGTAWGIGEYSTPFQGCPFSDHSNGQYWFYRYHTVDPIYFNKKIAVTIQQIGFLGPEPFASENKKFFREHDIRLKEASDEEREVSLEIPTTVGNESTDIEYTIFEREDDWSSCAYLYLDTPESMFDSIDHVKKRTEGLMVIDDAKAREIDLGFCNYD